MGAIVAGQADGRNSNLEDASTIHRSGRNRKRFGMRWQAVFRATPLWPEVASGETQRCQTLVEQASVEGLLFRREERTRQAILPKRNGCLKVR